MWVLVPRPTLQTLLASERNEEILISLDTNIAGGYFDAERQVLLIGSST